MPSNPLYQLRINARELLRTPGSVREIDAELAAADLGVADDRITGPIAVDLHVVSAIDGITVRGTISMPWQSACRRCLADVTGTAVVEVDELYQDQVGSDDAFQIEGDQIDLVPAVREYVVLELPDDPLCRDDCAGFCPVCGIDRNTDSCCCDSSVRDNRWAALDELHLDE